MPTHEAHTYEPSSSEEKNLRDEYQNARNHYTVLYEEFRILSTLIGENSAIPDQDIHATWRDFSENLPEDSIDIIYDTQIVQQEIVKITTAISAILNAIILEAKKDDSQVLLGFLASQRLMTLSRK